MASLGGGGPPRVTPSKRVTPWWKLQFFCGWILQRVLKKRSLGRLKGWEWRLKRSSVFWRKKIKLHHQLPHYVTPTLVTPLVLYKKWQSLNCFVVNSYYNQWCGGKFGTGERSESFLSPALSSLTFPSPSLTLLSPHSPSLSLPSRPSLRSRPP